MKHQFISKTIYFPKHGILAVGDLHIGYDYMIQQSGILLPENQVQEIIQELRDIILNLKENLTPLKKIIFIGDIKHSFAYEWREKNYFQEVLEFLKKYFDEENIVMLKGNHDTMDYSFENKLKQFHIEEDIAFIHGDKLFPEIFSKKISTIVMGHIHPSVILSDRQNIKRERYKCFLVGKWKKKQIIILPSFLSAVEGTPVNDFKDYTDSFSIIPKKDLVNFSMHVVGDDGVYNFGKIKKLKEKN